MFEESTKLKLPITANPENTATIRTTTTEIIANNEPIIDSIFDDEDASNSTDKNYMIDVPDIIEMTETKDPDPMINTEEEKKTEKLC